MNNELEATITAYPDGPYLVRGVYRILDSNGDEIDVGGERLLSAGAVDRA